MPLLLGYPRLIRRHIAPWALGLNLAWEFVQCTVFYDMWDWGLWRATVWMWGASLGDVVISLAVAVLAAVLVGVRRITPPDAAGSAALLALGFVASIGLEWAAQALGLWGYAELMPTVTVFGRAVGLTALAAS